MFLQSGFILPACFFRVCECLLGKKEEMRLWSHVRNDNKSSGVQSKHDVEKRNITTVSCIFILYIKELNLMSCQVFFFLKCDIVDILLCASGYILKGKK